MRRAGVKAGDANGRAKGIQMSCCGWGVITDPAVRPRFGQTHAVSAAAAAAAARFFGCKTCKLDCSTMRSVCWQAWISAEQSREVKRYMYSSSVVYFACCGGQICLLGRERSQAPGYTYISGKFCVGEAPRPANLHSRSTVVEFRLLRARRRPACWRCSHD